MTQMTKDEAMELLHQIAMYDDCIEYEYNKYKTGEDTDKLRAHITKLHEENDGLTVDIAGMMQLNEEMKDEFIETTGKMALDEKLLFARITEHAAQIESLTHQHDLDTTIINEKNDEIAEL